jgi:hypothetical protein
MSKPQISRIPPCLVRTAFSPKKRKRMFCIGFGIVSAEKNVPHRWKCANSSWWRSFKKRHRELAALTVSGVENARCEVPRADVLRYFAEVKNALAQRRTPSQLLNMDGTGFCSRPEKGRKRKVVFRRDFAVKPTFREHTDPNHVSLVATISFSGDPLKAGF